MDLQEEFNAMVESLQGKVSKDRHLSQRVSKQLDDLMKSSSSDALGRLKEIKAEVDHLTSDFKI